VTAYFDALIAKSKVPGLQYLVLDGKNTVFEYAGGSADLQNRVGMDPATTLMGYSMSKTVTAAAVLQLVDRGLVEMDRPVSDYVDFNPYHSITVRQLLSHTSGIPNPVPLRWVHLASAHEGFNDNAALRTVLLKHPRLKSIPGTRYAYSNIGYWLLGSVIEGVAGQTFTSYVTERVLGPLGVTPNELGYRIADFAPHALGYLEKYSLFNLVKGLLIDRAVIGPYTGSWLQIADHYVNGAAYGGLVGTARGFGRFLQYQLRSQTVLFGDSTRSLFYTPQATTNSALIAMTPGWHIDARDPFPFFYKEGGGGGFHCMMRLYPHQGLASVVMTNATGFPVGSCLDTADRELLALHPLERVTA
jgi:CubicO group peptidase (beta-lactamase class C family)